MPDWIDDIAGSEDASRKIRTLGASSPLMLAGVIKSAREHFHSLIGDAAHADDIERRVLEALSPAEREVLQKPAPKYSLGARLEPK